ncbi:hypothetical protein KAW64_04125, partial [bacterium]|nr:hypothetical protein [bacterium]
MLGRTSCVTGSPPDHRPRFFVFLALVAVLAIAAAPVLAKPVESPDVRSSFLPERDAPEPVGTPARLETLWIFDA